MACLLQNSKSATNQGFSSCGLLIILVTGPLGYYKETQFETVPKKEIQKIQETGLARVLKKDVK